MLAVIWKILLIKYSMDDHECPQNLTDELPLVNNYSLGVIFIFIFLFSIEIFNIFLMY